MGEKQLLKTVIMYRDILMSCRYEMNSLNPDESPTERRQLLPQLMGLSE